MMMMNNKTKGEIMEHLTTKIEALAVELNKLEAEDFARRGFTHPHDRWHLKKVGKKFAYLDCGGSGAFLVESATGELYNIKGYGVPDYNKKKKADIGNIATVNPRELHARRWNYLR